MKTLFILVDALKSNYLTSENMPFLDSLSKNGFHIQNIIPSPGFCERSEIFTGLDSYDSGNFSAIGYLPEYSPYKNEKIKLHIFEMFSCISKRYARSLAWLYYHKKALGMSIYQIPYKSLYKYALTEDGVDNFIRKKSILDSLDAAGKTYTLEFFTSLNSQNHTRCAKRTVEECINLGIDFIPFYIGEIDAVGHLYGSDIEKIRHSLIEVDKKIKKMYNYAYSRGYCVVVLGDHGMVPVSTRINMEEIMSKAKLKPYRDFEMFLDSTVARFWTQNKKVFVAIKEELKKLNKFGVVVDSSNSEQRRIPLDIKCEEGNSVYGDVLWCANPGILITPDYFNPITKKLNGMHGYLKTDMQNGTGLLVSHYNGCKAQKIDQLPLSGVCAYLCCMLDIMLPNSITNGWERTII